MPEEYIQALYTMGQFASLTALSAGFILNLIDEGKLKVVYLGGEPRLPYAELKRAMMEGI